MPATGISPVPSTVISLAFSDDSDLTWMTSLSVLLCLVPVAVAIRTCTNWPWMQRSQKKVLSN